MATRKATKKASGKKPATKLAEALILRADYNKRIEQLKARLIRNAKVQEGEKPAEDPAVLLQELEDITGRFEEIIKRINRTNMATMIAGGLSLADAIAKRDVLKLRQGIYRDLAAAATVTQDRHTRSEVKFKGSVSVAAIQRKADDAAKEHRQLDAQIQEANWLADLKE